MLRVVMWGGSDEKTQVRYEVGPEFYGENPPLPLPSNVPPFPGSGSWGSGNEKHYLLPSTP